MKEQIKVILERHPKLKYIQKCISGYRNTDFVKFMCGDDSHIMRLETFGEQHSHSVIYKIEINTSTDGFFALYRATLDYLYFADLMKFTPVVVWGKEVPYAEDEKINGSDNPFLYYFQQASVINEFDIGKSRYVIRSLWSHQDFAENLKKKKQGYDYTDEYLRTMGGIIKKYVRFQEQVAEMLNKDCNQILSGKKTIGIHVRGTDYRIVYKNHPIAVIDEAYFHIIDPLIEQGDYEQVFLATDDSKILDSFLKHYGDQLLIYYQDVKRSDHTVSVAFSSSEREHHHFLLGYEVLRDAYTMACCSGFIGNLSQVSIGTQMLKYSRDEQFEYLKIIDHGIHRNGKKFIPPKNSR